MEFSCEKVDLKKKLLILLDEVHYDEKWGLFLKNIFDATKNHKNILIIATGSSALKIKLNPDLSRRSLLEELYPLKFSEYMILKNNIYPQRGLSDNLIEAVLVRNFSVFQQNAAQFGRRLFVLWRIPVCFKIKKINCL